MLFTEVSFFVFFAIAFSVYWLLPGNDWRKRWLLATSCVFYGAWDWRFLFLLAASTVVDYLAARWMEGASPARRKLLLIVSMSLNVGILGFFKYFNFFVSSGTGLMNLLGMNVATRTLEIVLPVGISFYTFQSMCYTIDVYRGQLRAVRSLVDFALYITFFPQLVAGPIVRAVDFLPQLDSVRKWSNVDVAGCLILFVSGFIKKSCISDNLAPMVDEVFGNPAYYTASSIWMASIAYAVQIFCDFSGYSEMAIACAGLMGFRFEKNFDYPYLAANIVDFWRRWHISLSTWLRDYLYIPLGGSRGALSTTYRNLLLTMVLGGLWHGAGWTFILWGLLHGVALVANKEWQRRECGSTLLGSAVSFCSPLLTFWWVVLCWIFFRAETMTGAATMVRAYLFLDAEGTSQVDPRWGLGLMLLAVVHVLGHAIRNRTEKSWQALPEWAQAAALGCLVACIIPFIAVGARPFIYFQF